MIFWRRSANDVSVMDGHIGALVAPSSCPGRALLKWNPSQMIGRRLVGEPSHNVLQTWSSSISSQALVSEEKPTKICSG